MKKYNIVERLQAKNQKPTIQITEDLEVTVNTSTAAALTMRQIMQDESKDVDAEYFRRLYEITLGKESAEQVMNLDLTMEASFYLISAISSAFTGEELSEDNPFPDDETPAV